MGKQSWFYRLLKRIGLIKSYEITEEQKAEMCRMACALGTVNGVRGEDETDG